jgi:hypothetical protein
MAGMASNTGVAGMVGVAGRERGRLLTALALLVVALNLQVQASPPDDAILSVVLAAPRRLAAQALAAYVAAFWLRLATAAAVRWARAAIRAPRATCPPRPA